MVENMKGAHVSWEAKGQCWGQVQQGSASPAAPAGLPPTALPAQHKHQGPLGYFWLDKPPELPSSPVGSSQLFIHPENCFVFQVK